MTKEQIKNRLEELKNRYIEIDLMGDYLNEWQETEQHNIIAEMNKLKAQLENARA